MRPPLAARLRPTSLEEFVGQSHLIGVNAPLRFCIEQGKLHSMLLWGPPGTGKTTLAQLMANYCHAEFISLSAVMAGVKEIREVVANAKRIIPQTTVLFIDEIHRFNKAQQDALLPFVEDGTLCFIGATTENPSFEINNALLSRCRVYLLKALQPTELKQILSRALQQFNLSVPEKVESKILESADGDARRLLNIVEIIAEKETNTVISMESVDAVLRQDYRQFDKGGDLFYHQISALHKSVRGSSPDAALYWLCRMLDGGCDPLYIARRTVRMATEDIGNADPRALGLALSAWDTVERLGRPEGDLALAQVILYLAAAPKSNAAYVAFNTMMDEIRRLPSYDVPSHLCNAPTKMMKNMGYGKGYRYDHNEPNAFAEGQTYFPKEMGERQYYFPVERGLELKIAEKLRSLRGKKDDSLD